MRSRGDPAQLQPRSHTGTLQVAFSSIFSRKGDAGVIRCSGARGSGRSRPLSAGHGFLEGHRWFRRPSHVIAAKARVSGTPELSPRGTLGPILGEPLSECSQPSREEISSNAPSSDLASCFICKVNSIFYRLRLLRIVASELFWGNCLSRGAILT